MTVNGPRIRNIGEAATTETDPAIDPEKNRSASGVEAVLGAVHRFPALRAFARVCGRIEDAAALLVIAEIEGLVLEFLHLLACEPHAPARRAGFHVDAVAFHRDERHAAVRTVHSNSLLCRSARRLQSYSLCQQLASTASPALPAIPVFRAIPGHDFQMNGAAPGNPCLVLQCIEQQLSEAQRSPLRNHID